jgi:hypothetical protein
MYMYMCMHMYIIYVCTYVCVCIHIHIHICAHIYTFIHTYTHTYIHRYIDTYKHTYTHVYMKAANSHLHGLTFYAVYAFTVMCRACKHTTEMTCENGKQRGGERARREKEGSGR